MTSENDPLEEALTALETALDRYGEGEAVRTEKIEDIDPLAPPQPVKPATSIAGVEEALEAPIEVLREKLGRL